MGNLTKKQRARRDTKDALLHNLEIKNLQEKFYLDMVENYMDLYDDIVELNTNYPVQTAELNAQTPSKQGAKNFDVKTSAEKRQILREMRAILEFLGLKPNAPGDPPRGGGGFEEL